MLAVGNVIFKIIPYFIIANVVTMFLDGSKEFKEYLIMAIWIALSFIIAELFHSLTIILLRQSKLVLANLSIINKMAHRHKPPYFIILKSLFIFSWEFDIPQSLPATSLKFP